MFIFVPNTFIATFETCHEKIVPPHFNLAHDVVGRLPRDLRCYVHRLMGGWSSWFDCVDVALGRGTKVPPMKTMVPNPGKGQLLPARKNVLRSSTV